MLNTNKLTQTSLIVGVSAIASLVSSIAIAPLAQAATFSGTVKNATTITVGGIDYTSIMLDRAVYDNFGFQNIFFGDSVLISDIGGEAHFLRLSPAGGVGVRNGNYSYDVATKFGDVFTSVALDADVTGTGAYKVTKGIDDLVPNNTASLNLVSNNGSPTETGLPVGSNITKFHIIDTLDNNGDTLFSVSNTFTQVPRTTTEQVPVPELPEPGTLLGLLVMGGLGLAAKRKKRK
ncbi:PEP-CTERM sorting domain-containing protein [Crocosphaera sp. XPORK-15E]|uniref:PEP-CTERM sorting domain-containing protein n=1 Tax=Crocosphaera sp. XPORK-15E TaxID=3110247 RepID=UPI002B20855A|nr:PEP-CTERM sorting domain-containing protein [Crocosphaera sp. XPORK-15E]MEA5534091.1 PEP-CTERM sorting domain-containing protein [Crocosphaera sp. XPORK-15E]